MLGTAPKVTFSHVVALMSIEEPDERRKFEKRLVKDFPTVVDLRLEIQEEFTKRRKGGRNVRISATGKSAFQHLIFDLTRLTKRWNCRKEQIEGYLSNPETELPIATPDAFDAFRKAALDIGALVPQKQKAQK